MKSSCDIINLTQAAVHLLHTIMIERKSTLMQEIVMCSRMIDPNFVLLELPSHADYIRSKPVIELDRACGLTTKDLRTSTSSQTLR